MRTRPIMPQDEQLLHVLERARQFGYLGPGEVGPHVVHALGFAALVEERRSIAGLRVCDLGSGGGVPGLVLLRRWKESEWCFLDTNQRRMETLDDALADLGESHRASVVCARAEEAVRRSDLRGTFDLVVARGFSAPAVTAECAAPLLQVGGLLVVSEPPDDEQRWNADALAELGLVGQRCETESASYFVAEQVRTCPDRYPRRVGIPAKRPLF